MKNDRLEFNWPDVGRLEIELAGPYSAALRFTPSEKVIAQAAKMAPGSGVGEGNPPIPPGE